MDRSGRVIFEFSIVTWQYERGIPVVVDCGKVCMRSSCAVVSCHQLHNCSTKMELQAALNYADANPTMVCVPIRKLEDAIAESRRNGKPIMLYLHYEGDIFSEIMKSRIELVLLLDGFVTMVWDVDDDKLRHELQLKCTSQLHCNIVATYVEKKRAGLFLFSVGDEVKLERFYSRNVDEDEMLSELYNYSHFATNMETNDSPPASPVSLVYTFPRSIIDSGVKLMSNIRRAINDAVSKEKPLLVYLHNDECIFTKQFVKLLVDREVNTVFQFFTFFACDVDNIETLASVELVSRHHKGLNPVWTRMSRRDDGLFLFMTYTGSLQLHTIFDGVFDDGELLYQIYDLYCLHEEEKVNTQELVQKECILSAVRKFEDTFGTDHVPFQFNTLEKAINESLRIEPQHQSKFLVLWFFNEDDGDSSRTASFLCRGPIRELLEHLAYLVPWDVSNESHHRTLKQFARAHFDLDITDTLIDTKRNAVFFFVCRNNEPRLFSLIHGSFDADNFLLTVQELVACFQETHEVTDLVEMAVIEEFKRKNPLVKYICPKSRPLSAVIKEDCLCNHIQSRKMLLVVFSASEDKLLDNLITIMSKDVSSIKEQYSVVPWDISDDKKHDRLALALRRYFALENMEKLLRAKRTAVFVFMPIAKSLTLFSYIDEKKSVKKITTMLDDCKQFFTIEKDIEVKLPGIGDSFEGAAKFQQLVYDQLGNRDYDCFRLKDDEEVESLKKKISFAFYGPPTEEKIGEKEEKKRRTRVEKMFDRIVIEAKKISEHTDELVMTCIFNCLIPLPKEKLAKLNKDKEYDPQCDFTPIPVFVLRKCTRCPTANPCRIFIDQDFRVYQSWSEYLENNKLPRCLFLVPKNGKYQGDVWGNVRLEYKLSPACGIGPDIIKAIDIGSVVVGMSSGLVGVVAAVPALPVVAPAVVTGAVVAGISVGVYSIVRSSMTIHDRICHKEDMSIFNSEARGAYFNIVAGTLGFAGSGAAFGLAYFARNGANIGLVARGAVNGLTGVNLVVSGASVANSAFDVISRWTTNDETPSTLVVLQLSSSILFFGHAVYNVKSAGTIIEEAQVNSLREISASLRSNRMRKAFTKLTKETIRVSDNVQTGQREVIAYMKKLDNRDEVLQVLTRSNRELNQQGIRFSVKNGELTFNGLAVNISEFSNMSKMQRSEMLLNMPSMQNSTPKQTIAVKDMFSTQMASLNFAEIAFSAIKLFMADGTMMEKCSKMLNIFSNYVADKLVHILKDFLKVLGVNVNLNASFASMFPHGEVVVGALEMIIEFFKEAYCEKERQNLAENNADESTSVINRENVIKALEKIIFVASLSPRSLMAKLVDYSVKWLGNQIYDRCSNTQVNGENCTGDKVEVLCTKCSGYYYV